MGYIFQTTVNQYVTRITSGVEFLSEAESYIVPNEQMSHALSIKSNKTELSLGDIQIDLNLKKKTSTFNVTPDTEFYGLGQHQKGLLNHKGTVVTIKHDNTTIAIPFLITNKGYGILWDNSGAVTADFTKETQFTFSNQTGNYIDFYILKGDNIDQIIQNYWKLTGEASMLPKSTFGFWQSKMRYTSQSELLEVAEKYRQKNYPLDIIVVDFYHWTEMGDFEFDPKCWPNPETMFKRLQELHLNCMVSVWPYISMKSKHYVPMDQQKYLAYNNQGHSINFTIFNGEKSGLYDPFNPEARSFFWEKAKHYYEQGAKIWWLDSCEPDDGLNINDFIEDGINTIDGSLEDRINAYALMHCKTFYDGQRKDFPEERVLILARSTFAGCQRYGVTVWSGDVGYDFEALQKQIIAGLGATMSGLPFWTTDIGGFQGGDPKDEAYRELYIRWFQYGAFCPLFRVHGSRGAICFDDLLYGISRGENELWSFGKELEDIMVKYDNIRYELMPYIYSNARQTIATGTPLMRALLIDFEKDEKARTITDQFMLGKAMMVCPVLHHGARTREVYLPQGHKWYNYWTDESYEGGQTIIARAEIDTIPVFVKSGSIVPTQPTQQYSTENEKCSITFQIYTGENAEFMLYNDDGISYKYERGEFSHVKASWNEANAELLTIDETNNEEQYYLLPYKTRVIK